MAAGGGRLRRAHARSYVGFEDDLSFPQLEVELAVVDAGPASEVDEPADVEDAALSVTALPGGTTGSCESDRFATTCEERWHHDGLVVRLLVTDRVYFDRVTTSTTVLGDLVPLLVANLATGATDVGDPLDDLSATEAGAAAAGLDRFVSANAELSARRRAPPCPAIAGGEVEPALDAAVSTSTSITTGPPR